MRKQGKKRNVNYGIRPKAPVLVMRGIEGTKLETREWKAVNVFAFGKPTDEDFFALQDMLNLLLIAGQSSEDRKYAMLHAEKHFKPVLVSIQTRWEKTGKWGMSAEELAKMRQMVVYSREFWIRQPTELLAVCVEEAKAFYRDQEAQRKAEEQQKEAERQEYWLEHAKEIAQAPELRVHTPDRVTVHQRPDRRVA